MAKKNTLFKVDIREENPLKTILKNGKIPVVRVNKTGFQNYKQDSYKEARQDCIDDNLQLKKGCFVHIGGIRGTYVSGSHYNESINIGYIEPNEEVFSTYNFNNFKNDFSYTTAQNRYEEMIKNYENYFKTNKYSVEDFDIYAEAIVDAKNVVKVLTIKPQDTYLLLPYVKDKYLSFFDEETIFNLMENYILKSFWTHLGFSIEEVKNDFETDWDYKHLGSFWSYCFNYPFFKDLVLKEFVSFYTGNDFINSKEYYIKLKNAIKTWHNYIQESKYPILKIYLDYFNGIKQIRVDFRSDYKKNKEDRYFIYENTKKPTFRYTTTFGYTFSLLSCSYEEKKLETVLVEKDKLFLNKYREEWYEVLKCFEYFKELFCDLLEVEMPNGLKILKRYYNLEKKLKEKGSSYGITDENIVIIREESYIIEYDLTLLDAIITIPKDEKRYYNIENVPNYIKDDKFISYLEVLSNWKYL